MKRNEVLQRLQSMKAQALRVLRLLETDPLTAACEDEIRNLTTQLRTELEVEYTRTLPARAQKAMSMFELSVYSPTIEEMWKETGIRRLKIDGSIGRNWGEVLEAVVYKTSKYLTP